MLSTFFVRALYQPSGLRPIFERFATNDPGTGDRRTSRVFIIGHAAPLVHICRLGLARPPAVALMSTLIGVNEWLTKTICQTF
jgi:hypothetical protein